MLLKIIGHFLNGVNVTIFKYIKKKKPTGCIHINKTWWFVLKMVTFYSRQTKIFGKALQSQNCHIEAGNASFPKLGRWPFGFLSVEQVVENGCISLFTQLSSKTEHVMDLCGLGLQLNLHFNGLPVHTV